MIPDITPVNTWSGNGVTTEFDFDFLINKDSELQVLHTSENGIQTELKLNQDYTIDEIGCESGSYITFPILGSLYNVLGPDEKISLVLNIPIAQTSPFGTSSKLNMKSLEYALDYIVRLIQIESRKADRAVKIQEGSDITPVELINSLKQSEVNSKEYAKTATEKALEAKASADSAKAQADISTSKATIATEKAQEVVERTNEALAEITTQKETSKDAVKAEGDIQVARVQTEGANYATKAEATYTAGTGISIENNVISNTQTSAEWGNIEGNIESQTDLINYVSSKSGGLEVCDIGTALYIDETKGLRRYVNGQIVDANTNTQLFIERLVSLKATNPDYFTNESTWQAEAALNVDGCVYKFVLNYDDDGTTITSVRLPKYPEYVEIDTINTTTSSQKQTKLKLRYFIQIATGRETENNIVNDIELNNPFVLFTSHYVEVPLYNISWLKSDGEYHPKATYTKAYEALVVEQNTDIAVGTTVDLPSGTKYTKCGLSVKLSTDESATDYDFRINTTDETFRLPLISHRVLVESKQASTQDPTWYNVYSDGWCEQGGAQYITDSTTTHTFAKPFIDTNYVVTATPIVYSGSANAISIAYFDKTTTSVGLQTRWGGNAAAMNYNWRACGYINVSTITTDYNLYYYVGETVQNANLIDAGRIGEQIVDLTTQLASINSKVDNYINKIVWSGTLGITVGTTSLASLLPNDGHNYLVYGSSHVSAKSGVLIQQVSSDIATTAVVPCCTDGDNGRTSHAYGFWAIPVGTGRKITLAIAGNENWILGYYRL